MQLQADGEGEGSALTTFEATVTEATVALGTDDPDENELPLIEEKQRATLSGDIDADGTWEVTAVSWPNIDPDLADADLPPGVEFELGVEVDGPIRGTVDPEAGRMTGEMALRIALDVTVIVKSMQVEIPLDAGQLTTGESGAMTGDAMGLDGRTGTVTLVDNEFGVPSTETDAIDEAFGLPAPDPGTNWLSVTADLSIADPIERVN